MYPQSTTGGELEDVTNQGHNALLRYRRHAARQDLERSIQEFERALSICPLGHPCRAAAESNLATAKFIFCQVENMDVSLEVPLNLYHNALGARPVGHCDRPSTLVQLAAVYFAQYEKQGVSVEDARADALLREAIELGPPDSHENRAATFMLQMHIERRADPVQAEDQSSLEQDSHLLLSNESTWDLSKRLLDRFERFGDPAALQQAITILEELVGSTPVSDDRYRTGLAYLGVTLQSRFHQLGELNDIENAISMLRDAVDLTPHDHSDKAIYLDQLGNSFADRFERLGQLNDLDDAISKHREAVGLTPHGHPDRPGRLNNLGNSFLTRFECFGELSDLEDAILRHKETVQLSPRGDADKPTFLSSLGSSFFLRFQRLGELSDIEDAVLRYREAVDLTPRGHPDRPGHLNNLGNCCNARFRRLGELSVLEDAISTLKDALSLTPRNHPGKPGRLENLGNSLKSRFERLGELKDLEDAISVLRDAVDFTPHGHPDKPSRLNNLGNAFLMRFWRLGEPANLEDAISSHRNAVDLAPHKPSYLNNLSNSLKARFDCFGKPSNLEDAISILRGAIDISPHGHPDKPAFLHNLGSCFFSRFELFGEFDDLEYAILSLTDVVNLTPDGHPGTPSHINYLGNAIFARFERIGQLSDLEDAVSRQREAVALAPQSHPDKPSYLNSLGITLRGRFVRLGQLSDLEDAVSTLRDAADFTPLSHPDKPAHLGNLGHCLITRFRHLGVLSDLEEAISSLRDAAGLIPHGHPHRPGHLNKLGDSLMARFERVGELRDIEEAISHYSLAASAPIGPISVRFDASQNWISCARRTRHRSLLHAYSVTIGLLPQLAWIGLSLTQRLYNHMRRSDVAREAAATALDSGLPEIAVEWLEQGRSIVWGELFQLRSSYEALSSAHPNHARRLQELSVALEYASASREKFLFNLSEQTESAEYLAKGPSQQVANRHRTLAIERDKLLQEIRGFPGFEQFLLRKDFSQLRAAAHSGPVVILNAADSRCDALIILAEVDHVIHVPLPQFPFKRSAGLQTMLEKLLGHARVLRSDDREGSSATRGSISWESLLSILWSCVVKPVLNALAFSVCGAVSFWTVCHPFNLCLSPNRLLGSYRAFFGAPLAPSCFFPFTRLVSTTLSICNLDTKCSISLSHHMFLLLTF